jgi:hypothetical protein
VELATERRADPDRIGAGREGRGRPVDIAPRRGHPTEDVDWFARAVAHEAEAVVAVREDGLGRRAVRHEGRCFLDRRSHGHHAVVVEHRSQPGGGLVGVAAREGPSRGDGDGDRCRRGMAPEDLAHEHEVDERCAVAPVRLRHAHGDDPLAARRAPELRIPARRLAGPDALERALARDEALERLDQLDLRGVERVVVPPERQHGAAPGRVVVKRSHGLQR